MNRVKKNLADTTWFYVENTLSIADNKKKHCMHENISIEIHVWPLTGLLSCRIDLSNAYASSKNRIGKLGVHLIRPQHPHPAPPHPLMWDREKGLLPSSATLRKQDVLLIWRLAEILCFSCLMNVVPNSCVRVYVCACVCVCVFLAGLFYNLFVQVPSKILLHLCNLFIVYLHIYQAGILVDQSWVLHFLSLDTLYYWHVEVGCRKGSPY